MSMTCRELFEIEHPDRDIECWCPHHFNYLEPDCIFAISDCYACWDREVTNQEKLEEVIAKHESSKSEEPKHWGDRIAENLNLEKSENVELTTVMSREQRDIFNQCIERSDFDKEVNPVIVEPKIKDSGERREFETGAVRDIQEGKGRCDLMPLDVISDVMRDDVLGYIANFQLSGNHAELQECLYSFCKETYESLENAFLEVAKHFEAGAVKYGENNWQKGIPVHCYIDSAVRHYLKFLRGDDDEPHDRAFVWNIMCCIWTCIHKPELNDFCEVKKDD